MTAKEMTTEELKALVDFVSTNCSTDTHLVTGEKYVDSSAIRERADAMLLLAHHGLMDAEPSVGRRVRARWTEAGKALLDTKISK
jgi:hypothetical protein